MGMVSQTITARCSTRCMSRFSLLESWQICTYNIIIQTKQPTCDVEDREKSESKPTHFEHLLLLAALLNLSQALPVLSLEDGVIPSIEGRALKHPQLLIQQVFSRVLSRIEEEANLSCSSIISILNQLLHREVIVVHKILCRSLFHHQQLKVLRATDG